MAIAIMLKQLRVLEIVMICILTKSLYCKSLNKKQDERAKRDGYSSYGENDFGSSIHVSSGVLQYSSGDEQSDMAVNIDHSGSLDLSSISVHHADAVDSTSNLESSASNAEPWTGSGHASGYDIWLEPLPVSHAAAVLDSSPTHTYSTSSTHTDNKQTVNAIYSHDSAANFELPSSQLHTKIGSSSIGNSVTDFGGSIYSHNSLGISDTIDFNNVADMASKHYVKSYGK